MLYIKLMQRLQKEKFFIFSLQDLLILFPEENKKTLQNQMTEWVKRKYISRLKKNLYELNEKGSQDVIIPDLHIANKLYFPSYVSMETALSIYGLILGIAAQVTSITTRPTREFKNKHGSFSYRSCQKRAFSGYKLMQYEGFKIFIADREKALVDFIYFALRRTDSLNFDEERFDKHILKKLNWGKVSEYSQLFNNKTVFALEKLRRWKRC